MAKSPPDNRGHDLLEQFVVAISPLAPVELSAFAKIWEPVRVKRKTVLRSAGETERNLYFVLEGVQRAYYMGEQQQEVTIVFTYPPSFSGVADSFLTQTPSKYFFETLTESYLLKTDYLQVTGLMDRFHAIERLIRISVSHALKGVIERQIELACFSAEEKFITLLKRSPHLLNLIPHKYLASYLGIDATTFSKLLGKIRL